MTDRSEAALRAALVAAGRTLAALGLAPARTGNLGARLDDGDLLVTAAGSRLGALDPAHDLVRLDPGTGAPREHVAAAPSSERRVHLALLGARPDLHAVVHVHGPHAQAWSSLGEDLDTGAEELEALAGAPVRTAEPRPAGSAALAEAAAAALGERRAVLLARHGLVACGGRLDEAVDLAEVVERQAQVALLLRR